MVETYSESFHISWLVIYMVHCAAVATLNVVTIMAILVNRQLRARHSLIAVVNLAIADTFVGLLAIPCYIAEYGNWFLIWKSSFVKDNALMFRGAEVFSSIASLSFLVLICLERWYATFYPFKSRMTPFVTYVVGMVSTWMLAVVAVVLYLVIKPFFFLMAWLLGSTCIISIGYLAIYIKMRRQSQQRQQMRRGQHNTQEKELAKTLFIVTVSSIVCWVPFVVLSLLVYHRVHYNIISSNFGKLLQFTNSLINPVIYLLRMRDVRKAALQLVKNCSRDSPRAPESRLRVGITNTGMTRLSIASPSPTAQKGQPFQERNGPYLVTLSPSPVVEQGKVFQESTGSELLSPSPSPINDHWDTAL